MSKCPFKNQDCSEDCGLFISYDDLNETVFGRLKAIGVITSKDNGICSIKNMALAQSRFMFENSEVYRKR